VLPLPSEPTITGGEQETFEEMNHFIGARAHDVHEQRELKIKMAVFFTLLIASLCVSVIAVVRMKISPILILLLWIAALAFTLTFIIIRIAAIDVWVTRPGGLEILFHETIGAHDITVVRSENARALVEWAENYLDKQGITYDLAPTKLENLTAQYIGKGFDYFAFDLIDLEQRRRSVDPIIYEFKSESLYYPLEMSSTISGSTEITIITITNGRLERDQVEASGLVVGSAQEVSLEFKMSERELKEISPEIAKLFDGGAWVTALSYEGSLSDLSGDLVVDTVGGALQIDVSDVVLGVAVGSWCLMIVATSVACGKPKE
jgi:hypothetical protein